MEEEKTKEKEEKKKEHTKSILSSNVKSIVETYLVLKISMESYLLDLTENSFCCSVLSSQSLQISKVSSILGSVILRTLALKITIFSFLVWKVHN